MSDNRTLEDFMEPLTPQQNALRAAMAEIKDEAGRLKTKLRKEVRALRRKRSDCLVPSEQASLDQQIAAKQKDYDDVDCLFLEQPDTTRQDHFKRLVKWDETMRKHGVAGY